VAGRRATLAWSHQTWARDHDGLFRFDVFREPHDGDTWICRRDPAIRLPYREVVRTTAGGVPYEAPEVVLLFKAKHTRPKDDADFDTVLPLLDADALEWLHRALEQIHRGHPWVERVRRPVGRETGLLLPGDAATDQPQGGRDARTLAG
jgi:hypothetical protein